MPGKGETYFIESMEPLGSSKETEGFGCAMVGRVTFFWVYVQGKPEENRVKVTLFLELVCFEGRPRGHNPFWVSPIQRHALS